MDNTCFFSVNVDLGLKSCALARNIPYLDYTIQLIMGSV